MEWLHPGRAVMKIDPGTHEWATLDRLIVFDGICNWCNAWVDFTMAHDRGRFHFATLQSDQGQELLKLLGLPAQDFETFLLLERGRVFTKSTAAVKIARHLSGCWPLCALFVLVPRPLRDMLYDYVARHRYRLMGRAQTCRIPTGRERDRFV
jgi:predicted DCC family thiol-disulfide oxidoreductase YuxK